MWLMRKLEEQVDDWQMTDMNPRAKHVIVRRNLSLSSERVVSNQRSLTAVTAEQFDAFQSTLGVNFGMGVRKRAPPIDANEVYTLQDDDVVNMLNIQFTGVNEEQAANWFDPGLDLPVAHQIANGRNFVQMKYDRRTNEYHTIMMTSALRANCQANELNAWLLANEIPWANAPVNHGVFVGMGCEIDGEDWEVVNISNPLAIELQNSDNPDMATRVETWQFCMNHRI